ncbi:MAG TPA: tetratricopeptide repeat protein [Candidatus Angelobacter sp.]|nr:tetratricopeptide repeat protein [Candidatus Angelobacter sp.]
MLLEIVTGPASGDPGKRGFNIAAGLPKAMVELIASDHPDVREIWQGEGGKNPTAVCRRLIVEYTDGIVPGGGGGSDPFTTDYFFIGSEFKVLFANFKVLSREYSRWVGLFERIASSILIPGIGYVQILSRARWPNGPSTKPAEPAAEASPAVSPSHVSIDFKSTTTVSAGNKAAKPVQSEFLAGLSKEERLAVSNLEPHFYESILTARRAGYSQFDFVNLDPSGNFKLAGELLSAMDIADVERLAESVNFTIRGDEAAKLDIEEAGKFYRKAFELNPYDEIPIMSYGVVLFQQGYVREGVEWVEKALAANPASPRVRRNLEGMKSRL